MSPQVWGGGASMKLRLEWSRPIRLKDGSRENLIYTLDLTKIPSGAGVYIFGRAFGNSFEALYVGKASHVRWRVRTQLKNLPLMLHLQKAKIGKKFLMMGRFIPKPGQREAVCLPLLEGR